MSRVRFSVQINLLGRPIRALIDTSIRETIIHDSWIPILRGQEGVRFFPLRLMLATIGRVFPISALAFMKFTVRAGATEIIRYHPIIFLPYPPAEMVLGTSLLRAWRATITRDPLTIWICDENDCQLGLTVEQLSSTDESDSEQEN